MKSRVFQVLVLLLISLVSFSCRLQTPKILVFTKTDGFRHSSIDAGVEALQKLGVAHKFSVDTTSSSLLFTYKNLKKYNAVVFLNSTGNLLDNKEQLEFKKYINTGGGYVGVHAAADAEYNWPWYNKLVGAYFNGHPKVQHATLQVVDSTHLATKMLGKTWGKVDEWYNYKDLNEDVHVLLMLDEGSYSGGKNGVNHPMAWYHNYDGGRAFYTGLGHTKESYSDAKFLEHLLGGLLYAIGEK